MEFKVILKWQNKCFFFDIHFIYPIDMRMKNYQSAHLSSMKLVPSTKYIQQKMTCTARLGLLFFSTDNVFILFFCSYLVFFFLVGGDGGCLYICLFLFYYSFGGWGLGWDGGGAVRIVVCFYFIILVFF